MWKSREAYGKLFWLTSDLLLNGTNTGNTFLSGAVRSNANLTFIAIDNSVYLSDDRGKQCGNSAAAVKTAVGYFGSIATYCFTVKKHW